MIKGFPGLMVVAGGRTRRSHNSKKSKKSHKSKKSKRSHKTHG